MGVLLLILKVIAIIAGVALSAFGAATLVAAFTSFEDWSLRLTVICALLGWFILGMCVGSIWL